MVAAGVPTKDACKVVGIKLKTFYGYRARLKKLLAQARENAGPASATVATDDQKDTRQGGQ